MTIRQQISLIVEPRVWAARCYLAARVMPPDVRDETMQFWIFLQHRRAADAEQERVLAELHAHADRISAELTTRLRSIGLLSDGETVEFDTRPIGPVDDVPGFM